MSPYQPNQIVITLTESEAAYMLAMACTIANYAIEKMMRGAK